MKTLIVKTKFHITTTSKDGKIFAEQGDILKVLDKGCEFYNILKLNNKQIFSIWQRKKWIESKCEL